MWILMPQQQNRGAQLHARGPRPGKPGAPAEAVESREAQDHEQAGERAGARATGYPASRIENIERDNTPGAPDPRVEWDDVVQPERANRKRDELPLPEGK